MFFAAVLFAVAVQHPMLVSSDWLAQHLHDPLVVVVEVGAKSDYDNGHIPGARLIRREDVVADCEGIPNEIPAEQTLIDALTRSGVGDSKRIVVYSRDPLLATRTWFTLDYLGHGSRASVLDGGWEQWTAGGHEVTSAPTVTRPAPFTVFVRPYSVVKLEEMRDLIRRRGKLSQKLVTIDARPPAPYKDGHIPDAWNIPWTANLASDHPPLLRDPESLRQIYAAAGIDSDAIVLTYCRTGMEATMTYFVLRYLGYDVTLYDGSFVEWSAQKNAMIVFSK